MVQSADSPAPSRDLTTPEVLVKSIFSNPQHFVLCVGRMDVACPLPTFTRLVDTPLIVYMLSYEMKSCMCDPLPLWLGKG